MSMTSIARYAALIPLFIIPFLPLYVASDSFFPFITGKGFAFRILVEVAFFAYLALAFIDARYRPKFSWSLLFAGIFVVWMFIADLAAVNPHKALWSNFERMDGWVTLIHVFAFMLVASSVLSVEKLWNRWWLTFLGAAALVVGYGLLQIGGGAETHQGDRIDASFGNAAYLPAYLLFCIAIALWQGIMRTGWLRRALLALAALAVLVLIFTATRGAFLGLLGAGFVAVVLWLIEGKGTGKKIAFTVLAGIVLIAGSLFFARGTAIVEGSETLSRLASAFDLSSLEVRFTLWNMALQGAAERPILGWGQEGFNYVFTKYYEPSMFAQEPWFDRAHNVFLDWLIAGGFPALLFFLAFLGTILIALYRGSFTRLERVMLVAALVAYAIQGLAVFDNLFTYVPLFAIGAFVHSRVARDMKGVAAAPTVAANAMVPAALAVALVVVWVVNVPNIAAARGIIVALSARSGVAEGVSAFQSSLTGGTFATQEVAEQFASYAEQVGRATSIADADKIAVFTGAVNALRAEVAKAPGDPRIRLQLANVLASGGDYRSASVELNEALKLSPKKQTTYLQIGALAWQAGDKASARQAFTAAYELDTSFPVIAAYAAAGEVVTGNLAAGDALLVKAYGTPLVDTEFLRAAYYEAKQYNRLIELGKKKVADTNGDPVARLNLALLYGVTGNMVQARAELDSLVAAHPESAADAANLLRQLEASAK